MINYNEVFNELVDVVDKSWYCGYEVTYEQQSLIPLRVTGTHLISQSLVERINEIATKHNLVWFMWVNNENKPEIKLHEDE